MRALAMAFCCLVLSSCAGSQGAATGAVAGSPTVAPTGGGWRRIQTEHIELTTDLSGASALEAATALERTRAALLQAAWSKLPSTRHTERLHVLVLASGLDFERYFGRNVDGYHTYLGGETIVLWGTPPHWERRRQLSDASTTSTLRHEIVHHLAAGIYRREPRWFAEGLAQFLETIVIAEDGSKATLGRPNLVALDDYKSVRSLGVKDALAWGEPRASENEIQTAGLYGLSWLMVYWLFNTQPEAFASYQQSLARGEDLDRAWSSNFGDQSLDAIDKALFQYARFGQFQVYNVDLTPKDVPATPSALTEADVHALRAQLALMGAGREKAPGAFDQEAQSELERALALEPGNDAALRLLLRKGIPKAELVTRLRQQTRLRPDDGEAWLLLGSLLEGAASAAEREAALRKAIGLLPGNAKAYNALAWFLVAAGRGAEALSWATKASLLAPWDAAVLDTYAACLFAVGRCPDALRVQRRAVDNLSDRVKGMPESHPYTDALTRYRSECGEEAAAKP